MFKLFVFCKPSENDNVENFWIDTISESNDVLYFLSFENKE